jgi:hypothetical protein
LARPRVSTSCFGSPSSIDGTVQFCPRLTKATVNPSDEIAGEAPAASFDGSLPLAATM